MADKKIYIDKFFETKYKSQQCHLIPYKDQWCDGYTLGDSEGNTITQNILSCKMEVQDKNIYVPGFGGKPVLGKDFIVILTLDNMNKFGERFGPKSEKPKTPGGLPAPAPKFSGGFKTIEKDSPEVKKFLSKHCLTFDKILDEVLGNGWEKNLPK